MKRLLFIAHRMPYPPNKGERVRAFHEIRILSEHFRVSLAAPAFSKADMDGAAHMRQWCESVMVAPARHALGLAKGALSMAMGKSVTEGYFASRSLSRQIAAQGPYDVAIGYSSGVLPLLLKAPAERRVMDLVDVDSAKWASYARQSPFPKSVLFAREARGVRALEEQAISRCQAVILVSEAEKQMLRVQSDKVQAIGNGVDIEYFDPAAAAPAESSSPSIVFTGQMDYQPNVEGVCWFAREVWPSLNRQMPQLRFVIVGRQPTPAVRELAKLPGIMVTGAVSNVRPYLAAATIAIAPLQIARGIQNKILEAMAMSKAVIGSGVALEGIDAQLGRDVLHADSPQQWQQEIVRLLEDQTLRQGIERCARTCMEQNYNWRSRLEPLVSMCRNLAAEPITDRSVDAPSVPVAAGTKGSKAMAGGQCS